MIPPDALTLSAQAVNAGRETSELEANGPVHPQMKPTTMGVPVALLGALDALEAPGELADDVEGVLVPLELLHPARTAASIAIPAVTADA